MKNGLLHLSGFERLIPVLSLFLFCCVIRNATAEAGKVEIERLSDELRTSMTEACSEDGQIVEPAVPQPSEQEREIWRGNEPKLESEINDLQLLFGPQENQIGHSTYFRIKIESSPYQTTLRSSRSGLYNPEGGFILRSSENRLVPIKTAADARLRLGIATPSAVPKGYRYVVLFCPRILEDAVDQATGVSKPKLINNDIEINALIFGKLTAHLHTKILSGRGPAKVRGQLLTTNLLPRSAEHTDEIVTVNPEIALTYVASVPFENELYPLNLGKTGGTAQGFKLSVELQNNAGYVRSESLENAVFIERMMIKVPQDMGDEIDNIESPCFLVAQKELRKSRYGKEQLVLPEHLKK